MDIKLTQTLIMCDYNNPELSKQFFHRAMKSIIKYQPADEILLLENCSWNVFEESKHYKNADVNWPFTIIRQKPIKLEDIKGNIHKHLKPEQILKYWHHTKDLVINSILYAKYDWVRTLDLDDEIRFNVKPIIQKLSSNEKIASIVGCTLIYDERLKNTNRYPYKECFHLGSGSANVYKKEIVAKVAKFWEPGPWPDFVLMKIIKMLDYEIHNLDEIFSITHISNWNTRFRHKHLRIPWKIVEKNIEEFMKNEGFDYRF